MFRNLLLFPATMDHGTVRLLADEIASAYRTRDGYKSTSVSVGPLMGPGAHGGQYGSVIEVVLDTLDNAIAALTAEDFTETRAKAESFGAFIVLYEYQDL